MLIEDEGEYEVSTNVYAVTDNTEIAASWEALGLGYCASEMEINDSADLHYNKRSKAGRCSNNY